MPRFAAPRVNLRLSKHTLVDIHFSIAQLLLHAMCDVWDVASMQETRGEFGNLMVIRLGFRANLILSVSILVLGKIARPQEQGCSVSRNGVFGPAPP